MFHPGEKEEPTKDHTHTPEVSCGDHSLSRPAGQTEPGPGAAGTAEGAGKGRTGEFLEEPGARERDGLIGSSSRVCYQVASWLVLQVKLTEASQMLAGGAKGSIFCICEVTHMCTLCVCVCVRVLARTRACRAWPRVE